MQVWTVKRCWIIGRLDARLAKLYSTNMSLIGITNPCAHGEIVGHSQVHTGDGRTTKYLVNRGPTGRTHMTLEHNVASPFKAMAMLRIAMRMHVPQTERRCWVSRTPTILRQRIKPDLVRSIDKQELDAEDRTIIVRPKRQDQVGGEGNHLLFQDYNR